MREFNWYRNLWKCLIVAGLVIAVTGCPDSLSNDDENGDGNEDGVKPAWYMNAAAISLEDLGGTMGDQIKDLLTQRAVASEEAQDVLADVLDNALDGRFDRAYFALDGDTMTVGSGLVFIQYDENHAYERLATGVPSFEFTNEGLLYDNLHLPLAVRRDGPIIALHQETIDAFEEVMSDLIHMVVEQLSPGSALPIIDIPDGSSVTEADIEAMVDDYVYMIDDVLGELQNIPSVPNDAGTAEFSLVRSYDLQMPYSSYDPQTYDPTLELVPYAVDIEFEMNMDRDASGNRWTGAASFYSSASSDDPDYGFDGDLSVSMALGLQKIDDPEVVYLEPGDGTKVDGGRLAGTWTASFSADSLGFINPALTSQITSASAKSVTGTTAQSVDVELFLRIVFSDGGDVEDVLVATSDDGSEPADEDYDSVIEAIADYQDQLEQNGYDLGIDLNDIEYRTTLDASGSVRVDVLLPGGFEAIFTALTDTLGVDLTEADIDFSEWPELPLVSLIGTVNGDTLDANILFLVLYQSATFTR